MYRTTEIIIQRRNFRYLNTAHKLLDNYLFKTDSSEESPILTDILMDQKKLEIFLPFTNIEKPVVKDVVLLGQKIKMKK